MAEVGTPGGGAVVVDELPIARRGLADVLAAAGVETVVETHAGREAVQLVALRGADLVVAGTLRDLRIDTFVRRLKRVPRPPRVLVLLPGPTDVVRTLVRAGVDGLALRSAPTAELERTVRRVLAGAQPIAAGLLTAIRTPAAAGGRPAAVPDGPTTILSPREHEVLRLLAHGGTNHEIARELFLSDATVKSHLARIYEKLGAHGRGEALAAAMARGLLE